MRVERVAAPAALRGLIEGPESVGAEVAEIIATVRKRGDTALASYAKRFDDLDGDVVVTPVEIDAALMALDPKVRAGLEVAIRNVRAVAQAWVGDERVVALDEGHTVTLRELPVRRAGIYAPGGRNPYPSTVVMGVVAAKAAGVDEVVLCVPQAHDVMLAAAALCGADEVLRTGGAHTIAALAYGTQTVRRVDVIAGPGGLHVQEAKRQLSLEVGVDMFAGPSDLMVVAEGGIADEAVIADLLGQAEHGEGSLAVLVSTDAGLLESAAAAGAGFASEGVLALLDTSDWIGAIEEFGPEHLQLVGPEAERLAGVVRNAGCVFVGAAAGTAFGDYVAGSNHTLPTSGAARFASGLNPGHFRRRVAEVRIGADAAARLAPAGEAIARAEGFEQHARSMALRKNGDT